MAIDFSQLRNLPARQLIAALVRDGFFLDRQVGSHQHYLHPDRRHVTISPHRSSETFTRKTLKSIINQARWTEEDLRRLGLLK